MMEIFIKGQAWKIKYPDPKTNKYPTAIIMFKDIGGSEVKISLSQELWELFKESVNYTEKRSTQ